MVALTLTWLVLAGDAWVVRLGSWIDGLGPWAAPAFALVYAVSVVLFVPGALMTMLGGVLFGIVEGTLVVTVGAVAGCSVSFLIARYLARDWIERRLATSPRYAAVDRAIGEQGFRLVLLLRLSPVFPFTPGNFLLGLTRVRFRDYTLASVGMIPGTVLYVYYGGVMGDLAVLAGGSHERGPLEWGLVIVGLLLATLATWLVARAARRAIDEQLEEE